ncbi:MAG: histidine kinase [Propionibacteriaceae bacterium]|nr:histidine kinase [Propionibacteriaceae bacterium]
MTAVHPSRARGARTLASPGLASLVAVLLLLIALPTGGGRTLWIIALQAACCLAAGLAVVRPVSAGISLGILMVPLMWAPTSLLGLAVLSLTVPIAVAAIRGHRIWSIVFAGWYLGISVIVTVEISRTPLEMAIGVNFWVIFLFAPLLIGEVIRGMQQRTERQRKQQLLTAERQRRAIARDLHDTLAYATTTMVMRAEQSRLRGGHDDQTLDDLDFIAATGRSASADLRTMLALLRDPDRELNDDPDPLGVLPMSRLEEVVGAQLAKLRAFDFEVNLAINGTPAELSERLSTVVARVFTEAASNITKHGDPRHEVTVMIDIGDSEVEAVFVNAVRPDGDGLTGPSGLGLLGLRELVGAEGGTLTSEPVGGRWITHLTIPIAVALRGGDSRA